MLYDICRSIIAPAIFENGNLYEEIDKDIDYKIYDFLKSKYKKNAAVWGKKFDAFEVRYECRHRYKYLYDLLTFDWGNTEEVENIRSSMGCADNKNEESSLNGDLVEKFGKRYKECFSDITSRCTDEIIEYDEELENEIEFIGDFTEFYKLFSFTSIDKKKIFHILVNLYKKMSIDCRNRMREVIIGSIFKTYKAAYLSKERRKHKQYSKVEHKIIKTKTTGKDKEAYFKDICYSIYETYKIGLDYNKKLPTTKQNDFRYNRNEYFSFTVKLGERFKKIFEMGLDNKTTKKKYEKDYTKKYQDFPDSDTIKNNFNKFVIEKYGVDIIGTCGEDSCDEHMIYIMNNIIVPALFNNTQHKEDYISDDINDDEFFAKIPEYFESKGLECKFNSEDTKNRYKYKDLFISLGIEHCFRGRTKSSRVV